MWVFLFSFSFFSFTSYIHEYFSYTLRNLKTFTNIYINTFHVLTDIYCTQCYLAVIILHVVSDKQGESNCEELELNGVVLKVGVPVQIVEEADAAALRVCRESPPGKKAYDSTAGRQSKN